MGDLFYHLGTVVGGLSSAVPGKPGAEPDPDTPPGPYAGPDYELDDAAEDGPGYPSEFEPEARFPMVAGTAAAWLVGRVLRPRPVSWPRVIIAGLAATYLADLAGRTVDGVAAPADDPEATVRRYGTGIALAAGYAAIVYPRLPGPPLLRGVAFGLLDLAAASRGGLVGLVADSPTLRFPLHSLAARTDGPLASPLAFGLTLGLLYSYDPE